MPKNEVNDLITDQEMHFARLILAGKMTDREAARAAGLQPSTAAYTKSLPRIRAYMLEHRAAVEQEIVKHETEALRHSHVVRERVLTCLWQIATLSPEMTRNSTTGQVKAISMIIAIEGLIPDRRAAAVSRPSTPQDPAPEPTAEQPAQPEPEPDSTQTAAGYPAKPAPQTTLTVRQASAVDSYRSERQKPSNFIELYENGSVREA